METAMLGRLPGRNPFFNKIPILNVLRRYEKHLVGITRDAAAAPSSLSKNGGIPGSSGGFSVLEIASGSGQHAQYFTDRLASISCYQPTECDVSLLPQIERATTKARAQRRVLSPLQLDVTNADHWERCLNHQGSSAAHYSRHYSSVLAINFVHAAPWAATQALIRRAGDVLFPGGLLLFFGPLKLDGKYVSDTHEGFDQSIKKTKGSSCGMRDVTEMVSEASAAAASSAAKLQLIESLAMPDMEWNFLLVFETSTKKKRED